MHSSGSLGLATALSTARCLWYSPSLQQQLLLPSLLEPPCRRPCLSTMSWFTRAALRLLLPRVLANILLLVCPAINNHQYY
eukprot:SAG25_NODE_454_length_7870_cov_2.720499_8_plen_81_part_00